MNKLFNWFYRRKLYYLPEYQDVIGLWGPFFHQSNKMGGQIICEYK